MDVLTAERAKPALPFAGTYQVLDFALSNLSNSRLDDVWLTLQYQAASLEGRVHNGRPWDLDRTRGGLRLIVPEEGSGSVHEEGFSQGNADELYQLRDLIRDSGADLVLTMSADHIYTLDHRDVVEAHLARDAEVTVVTTDVADLDGADPSDHAVCEIDDDGRISGVAYKPDDPTSTVVAAEIIVYRADLLVTMLEDLHRELTTNPDDTEETPGLGDFGDLLLPRFVERGRTFAFALPGYWRDIGQPHHYLNAHLELLESDQGLFRESWPIRTTTPWRPPARVQDGAAVTDSLLSSGCRVAGEVTRSVLGQGVVVEAGAVVTESVLFADTVVEAGARVHRSIVDTLCRIGPNARIGDPDSDLTDSEAIVLVGRDSVVDSALAAGARVPPGGTVD